jgi:hypothetical protein
VNESIDKVLKRIRNAAPLHMFSRDQGVMLGDGEVWVTPVESGGNIVPIVTAINNDL